MCVYYMCVFLDKRGSERGCEVFVFSQMSVKGYSVVMDVGARRGGGGVKGCRIYG